MKNFKKLIFILLLSASCGGNYQIVKPYFGETEILNYEYSNKYFLDDVRSAHFYANINIDKPYSVEFPDMVFGDIYDLSEVNTSAVTRVYLDSAGRVKSFNFIKRPGLGLDRVVENIITKMRFVPLYHKSEPYDSSLYVRIILRGIR